MSCLAFVASVTTRGSPHTTAYLQVGEVVHEHAFSSFPLGPGAYLVVTLSVCILESLRSLLSSEIVCINQLCSIVDQSRYHLISFSILPLSSLAWFNNHENKTIWTSSTHDTHIPMSRNQASETSNQGPRCGLTTSLLPHVGLARYCIGPGNGGKVITGSLSNSQSCAVLIASLSCAFVSLLLVLIALRWFLIMRRCFRDRLILHLIISDTLKAIWYFVFPIIVFARGPVSSTSNFCQASGFLLTFALEASDMAILIIALHSTLCILRPNNTIGEGGLYHHRKWVYLLWLGPPLIAASLAFVKSSDGYTTSGTFCYLPKRPIWYRLTLAWIPRYLIITWILIMYVWIYIYVHLNFRGFDHLRASDSSHDSEWRRRSGLSVRPDRVNRRGTDQSNGAMMGLPPLNATGWRPGCEINGTPRQLEPWDHANFITASPVQAPVSENNALADAAGMTARGSEWSCTTHIPPPDAAGQIVANEAPKLEHLDNSGALKSAASQEANIDDSQDVGDSNAFKDPLRKTRIAIRKQLRHMFVYPLIYLLMWSFPFASHVLNYNDYYVRHPVFWLSVLQTSMLALQAGVDSVMFSFSERPWRRIDSSSRFSMPALRRRGKALLQRRSLENPDQQGSPSPNRQQPMFKPNPTWWEAEGRHRNDRVWLGTNTMSHVFSPTTIRTRSRSPPKLKQSLHSRTRSSEQGASYAPRLESILPGTLPSPRRRDGDPDATRRECGKGRSCVEESTTNSGD